MFTNISVIIYMFNLNLRVLSMFSYEVWFFETPTYNCKPKLSKIISNIEWVVY